MKNDLQKFGRSLDSVWQAKDLFEKINNQEDEEVTLNFEDIRFISLSFSQANVYFKRHSPKTVKEINLSKENRILQVVADKFDMKIG